jgi:hypothetical protein
MLKRDLIQKALFVLGILPKTYSIYDFDLTDSSKYCLNSLTVFMINGECFAKYRCRDGFLKFDLCRSNFSCADWKVLCDGSQITLPNVMVEVSNDPRNNKRWLDLVAAHTPKGLYWRVWTRHIKVWVKNGLQSHETYGILELMK